MEVCLSFVKMLNPQKIRLFSYKWCAKKGVLRKIVGEEREVISWIPVGENQDELKKVIKGGDITGIKRLQVFRDGEKLDSTSVTGVQR